MTKKIFNRSIPMPDNASPTGAKKVIVSSAENRRFASCGAVRPGIRWFHLSAWRLEKTNTRCNGLAANSAKVRNARTIALNVEIDDCGCYVQYYQY